MSIILRPGGMLCNLAQKHGTDKGTHNRTDGLCYLDIYEQYFQAFRNKKINILEIGVRTGNSLSLWQEYFPDAVIYGVDIDPGCKQYETNNVKITIGDATKEKTINQINDADIKYSIVIDDGSHVNGDIIKSFDILWDSITPGGIYVIEDLYCSYGGATDSGIGHILGDSSGISGNKRNDICQFFNHVMQEVDTPGNNKLSIHFWDSICVIIKGLNERR